jgi:hypothetical protein
VRGLGEGADLVGLYRAFQEGVGRADPQMDEAAAVLAQTRQLPHSHGGQPIKPATEQTIQTKLATDANASDSRARRTICRNLL